MGVRTIWLFDSTAQVATCIYKSKGKSDVRLECSIDMNKINYL